MGVITVGQVTISNEIAKRWIHEYTSPEKLTSKKPYAYPAYDNLDTGSGANELNDGDLLAPALLNSAPSVSGFYRFQDMKARLQDVLTAYPDAPLISLDDDVAQAKLRTLYRILDEDRADHDRRGQGGTTLSKILHRKHPKSLPLHDKWVRRCYLGSDGVPIDQTRPWADYMALVTQAIKTDLTRQQDEMATLRTAVQGSVKLTDLRLLDILAWTSKGKSASA